jgi:hypothetical protein
MLIFTTTFDKELMHISACDSIDNAHADRCLPFNPALMRLTQTRSGGSKIRFRRKHGRRTGAELDQFIRIQILGDRFDQVGKKFLQVVLNHSLQSCRPDQFCRIGSIKVGLDDDNLKLSDCCRVVGCFTAARIITTIIAIVGIREVTRARTVAIGCDPSGVDNLFGTFTDRSSQKNGVGAVLANLAPILFLSISVPAGKSL